MADSKPDQKQTETAHSTPTNSTVVPSKSKSSNKTLIIVLVIVGLFVVIPGLLIAAGGYWLSRGDNVANITEKAIENATGADIEIDKDGSSLNIKTDDGSLSYGTDQKLPDNLPGDVVMYDNQKIIGVFTTSQDGSSNWSISAETSDEISKVTAFIESKYAEKGWDTTSTATYNGSSTYNYKKGTLTAYVVVAPMGDEGLVGVSYSIQEE